jgi:sugar lactone lactonase YvrE
MQRWTCVATPLLTLVVGNCATPPADRSATTATVEEVARSPRQWTGIAVMPDGRIFVNFPRWSDDVPVSVAELRSDGTLQPFPSPEWHGDAPPPARRFVCVQSVVADRDGFLWVLDSGNPLFGGVIPGAPKLLKFDVRDGSLLASVRYDAPVVGTRSYLNDVRVDTGRQVAYLTDSGTGALIVTELRTGTSRRLLDGHLSVMAEDIDVVIDGVPWRMPGGARPRVHSDGIALSPDGDTLYFQALTGRTLYRIATAFLRDASIGPEALGDRVERVGATGPADGLECAPDGTLYLTSLEDHSVKRLRDGTAAIVAQDPRLQWPDSLAVGPDGLVYVATSRIHIGSGPYGIYRFKPPGTSPR